MTELRNWYVSEMTRSEESIAHLMQQLASGGIRPVPEPGQRALTFDQNMIDTCAALLPPLRPTWKLQEPASNGWHPVMVQLTPDHDVVYVEVHCRRKRRQTPTDLHAAVVDLLRKRLPFARVMYGHEGQIEGRFGDPRPPVATDDPLNTA